MRIYYHDESDAHPTAAHDSTGEYLGLDELKRIGVLGYTGQDIEQVDAIATERGYVARDEVRPSIDLLERCDMAHLVRVDGWRAHTCLPACLPACADQRHKRRPWRLLRVKDKE